MINSAVSGLNLHITLGDMEISRAPRAVIESVRHKPLEVATLELPDPDGSLKAKVEPVMPVAVSFGYRGEQAYTFEGEVKGLVPGTGKDQVSINILGKNGLPLVQEKITQAFKNESPEAIIRWAAARAGLDVAEIEKTGATLPHFISSGLTLWQLARQAEHTAEKAFSLPMHDRALWMGEDGLHWGSHDQPGPVPVIATGKNLINHSPAREGVKELSQVETFLLPGFSHSRLFVLQDAKHGIDDTYRALTVRHEITPNKARTFLLYGEEHAKF